MPFNLTNITAPNEAPTVLSFFTYANEATGGGWFGLFMLLVIFAVPFIGMLPRWGGERAFTGAAFLTAVFSLPLLFAGLIPDIAMYASFIAVGAGVLWLSRT